MFRFLIPLFLLTFLAAASADTVIWPPPPGAPGASTAETPAPQGGLDQFQDHVNRARSGPVDLIFDGDSITDFWQSNGKKIWQQHYGMLNAIDFGVSGDRTEHVLWRLNHGELDGLHPKLIVLMIGTNNLGRDPKEIEDGITQIVQTMRTDCPDAHILLLGIFPRGNLATDGARPTIKQINDVISKLDDGTHVTYRDIGEKFLQPDGTLTAEIMPDFLHPSEKGYVIWADAIQDVVDQYCPKPNVAADPQPMLTWPYPLNPPTGVSASTFPVPHFDWMNRFQQNLDKLKMGPYDLIFDGDSITDFFQNDDRGGPVWKTRYVPLKGVDMAISGDQIQHLLWRLQNGELEGQDPKLIVLMIGTNNIGQVPEDVAKGIKLALNEYETRCPHAHILLLGIFPRDPAPTSGARDWIAKMNKIISTYDDGKRVTYLDIGSKFLQPDGSLSADIMPDYLHPSTKGYTIWADAIQPVIDQYFPAAPK